VYCLHYLVKLRKNKSDDRLQWCRQNKKWLFWMIILSFVLISGSIIYHYHSIFGPRGHFNYSNLTWFIVVPLLALGYSYPLIPWNKKSLRQIGWLKMALLSFTWSFTTVVLPVLMLPDKGDLYTRSFFVPVLFVHRFVFIAALSFLFNIRDLEEDSRDGIKTLAVMLGQTRSLSYGKWIMAFLNIVFTYLLLWCFELQEPAYYVAAFIPVFLLFFLYEKFTPTNNEAAFELHNDGLMLIKALLLIFAITFLT
jgi:4-hydroxybenzoate polyprenyltransferase